MRQKEFTQKTALSKDELNRIYKYRNNKIIQWVFLLAVVLLLLVIMISYLTKEFMNSISVDIIWDILFVVLFILSSPIFGLNDNKLFTESKIRNIILENTPFVSDQISGSLSALDDISDLINNKDEISDSEFNCKSINIMKKNNVIEKDSLEYLYSKNKITRCKKGK